MIDIRFLRNKRYDNRNGFSFSRSRCEKKNARVADDSTMKRKNMNTHDVI